MERIVEREILDHLPETAPEAQHSRRDLRRINAWMGNPGIIARELAKLPATQAARRLVELGCGDATFLLSIARKLPRGWGPVEATLVDRQNIVSAETLAQFKQLGWQVRLEPGDVFAWLKRQPASQTADVITANLFLHHFQNSDLSELLHLAARQTHAFIACEPERFRWAIFRCMFLRIIGCNAVTRHDALVSVKAGFRNDEMSRLWPQNGDWKLRETLARHSSHLFIATR